MGLGGTVDTDTPQAQPPVRTTRASAQWRRLLERVPDRLWPRWLFLRALGLVFFSAFYALAFQIHGLVGKDGILPAGPYLAGVARVLPGVRHVWAVPTVLWTGAGDAALTVVVAGGVVASLLLIVNAWPRVAVATCTLLFLSCVSVLQDFNAYQSDGMLLEAGFLSIFFAPGGRWPGLGASDPPSRASLALLQWEWFRIYFASGVVKLASGDPHWRDLTAMDHYYENGPLPSWPGWYVQQLPHWYHASTVLLTLGVELVLVWALFLPRRARLLCAAVVTALQLGIIATANYAFLNYLVLVLGVLLLDDRALAPLVTRLGLPRPNAAGDAPDAAVHGWRRWRTWSARAMLAWVLYATVISFPSRWPAPLETPARLLAPFRIANTYGLFANMTEVRDEIEFQGTRDGRTWIPYRFRYKPQDPREAPGIYAPYQPRFDWNLWFASLGSWRDAPWVVVAQARLLEGSPSVLKLFREDPLHGARPTQVRTVRWRYTFTDLATRRATGRWWNRTLLGEYAGVVRRGPDGRMELTNPP
jgi:lipase maturation factor 1